MTLSLPYGVRWANSVPGTPVEITLQLDLMLLPVTPLEITGDAEAESSEDEGETDPSGDEAPEESEEDNENTTDGSQGGT